MVDGIWHNIRLILFLIISCCSRCRRRWSPSYLPISSHKIGVATTMAIVSFPSSWEVMVILRSFLFDIYYVEEIIFLLPVGSNCVPLGMMMP
jgi:hypothetical protein